MPQGDAQLLMSTVLMDGAPGRKFLKNQFAFKRQVLFYHGAG
jgi:hypothetical protein